MDETDPSLCDIRSYRIGETDAKLEIINPHPSEESLIGVINLGQGQNCLNVTIIKDFQRHLQNILAVLNSDNNYPSTAIIIHGSGKYFCNGLHIPSFGRELLVAYQQMIADIVSCPVPMIAAINGHAVCLLL